MANTHRSNSWLDWIKAIVIAVITILILRSFVLTTSIVEGDSMSPTLEDGEKIVFNKIVYMVSEPHRGDIVIIQHSDKNYVKRIIGLPGETIEVFNHELYINEEKYDNMFVDEQNQNLTADFGPHSIPSDSYFVIGDNRAISLDSRNGLGYIKKSEVIGKSEFIIYPLDEWQITR